MTGPRGSVRPRMRANRVGRAVLVCLSLLTAVIPPGCGGPSTPSPITEPPPAPPPPPPPTPPPTLSVATILAFGDSMTEGTTSPRLFTGALTAGLPHSYPFRLQELVTTRYTGQTVTVLNAGRAGERVVGSGAPERFNRMLSEARPDLVLLMEGANDLNDVHDMVNEAIAVIVGNLEEMVKEAGRRNIPIMVGTLPPQRLPKGMGAPHLGRFNAALREMASKKGAILIDVNALMPDSLIGQDGLHPTEEGYQRLAEIYLDAIKARYESSPSSVVALPAGQ